MMEVLEKPPAPPRSLAPGVDRDMELICLKCLEKDPKRRYATAANLADDLRRWLTDEPLSVRPPGLAERAARWLRRYAAAAAAVLAIALIWGMSVGVLAARQLIWVLAARQLIWGDAASVGVLATRSPEETELLLRLWPRDLSNPLGWVRLVVERGDLAWVALGLAAVPTLALGWVIAVLARPRDRRSALAAASSCGLVATVVAFLVAGPLAALSSRDKIHPIDDDYLNKQALIRTQVHDARGREDIPPSDMDYLKQFLPEWIRHRPDILLQVVPTRYRAQFINRLYGAFRGTWSVMLGAACFFLGVSTLGTLAVVAAQSRSASPIGRALTYAELDLPGTLWLCLSAVLGCLAIHGTPVPTELPKVAGLVMSWLGVLAALPWVMWLRRWPWPLRVAFYAGWTVVGVVLVQIASVFVLIAPLFPLIAPLFPQAPPAPAQTQLVRPAFEAVPAPWRPNEPRAQEVLDALAKKYRGLKTYRDTGRATVKKKDFGANTTTTFELTSLVAFVRPDRLRVEIHRRAVGPLATLGQDLDTLLLKEGEKLRRTSTLDNTFGPPSTLEDELGGIAGGSVFLVHGVVHLLLDTATEGIPATESIPPHLGGLWQANRLDDEPVGGGRCHRVRGLSGTWDVTIWVDAKSGLLRRLDLRNITGESSIIFDPVADEPIPAELLEFRPVAPAVGNKSAERAPQKEVSR